MTWRVRYFSPSLHHEMQSPEFPTEAHAALWSMEHLSGPTRAQRGEPLHHAFSHFDLELKPLLVYCAGEAAAQLSEHDRYQWYDLDSPAQVGLPRPIAMLLARG